ncbi:molybdopterin-dependent oxidoreductase [Desulfuribacillus alkaliarsenatis]|uniref:Oxidoreductase molybdopterin-binding domain-containing protein n=1 Tax=Desulfuribacillus alkaliarsenatis TaxID=766136 RepID=A0A1E5FZE1_9FIRM|nr:molybdopterin-dependent oxidoreductase [Desulfuribacillus alkaliarsenatis]OEF95909.1 hypothetical protein BHF68_10995 [Desulfuribacillus alkaliarsenatis]
MKKVLGLFVIFSLIISMGLLAACSSKDAGTTEEPNVEAPEDSQAGNDEVDDHDYGTIEVIGKDGTTQIVDLSALETVTGFGGVKRSTGTINGPGQITGIPFEKLLAGVGGFTAEDMIQVIATDGYEAMLTGNAISGDVATYDENGEPASIDVRGVIMISSDSEDLNAGLPRVAFIGNENVITDGFQWARYVATVKVIGTEATEEPIAEEPAADPIEAPAVEEPAPATEPTDEEPAKVTWTIEVVGGSQATLTNIDAEKIGVKNVTATHRDRDGNLTVQEWTGLLVKDLMVYLGKPNATEVTIEAIDGFNRTYDHELISSDGTLIAWMADGVALDENGGPVQTVADGKGPNWWIKQVAKITIH